MGQYYKIVLPKVLNVSIGSDTSNIPQSDIGNYLGLQNYQDPSKDPVIRYLEAYGT